jgi:ABC-type dipeptide/oligopeptide/nickel transport system permease subunit
MHILNPLSERVKVMWHSRPLRRLRADPASSLGIAIIAISVLTAGVVTIDKQFLQRALINRLWGDPYTVNLRSNLESPSLAHPFGTDHLGRDVLARAIYGTQTSILVGLASVAFALPLGLLFGIYAAYLGGEFDEIVMRVMDVFLTPPANILALGLVGILGRGLENIILGIGIVYTPIFARLIRGSALKIKQMEFIESARAIGESDFYIVFRELLPNCLTPVIIQGSFSIALAIMWEAGMSFLGLGVMPPASSWGLMLHEGQQYIREAWWLSVFPGVAIMVTTLGFNLVGNALRDALDPKYQAIES